MKIIHCIGKLRGGGAETQLRLFLENSGSFQNIVVSYDFNDDLGTTYYQIDKKTSLLKKWRDFYNICKIEKPDVIHIWLPAVFHIYCVPAFFLKTPKLLGVRNVYQLSSLKRFLHLMFYLCFKNIVSNTYIEDHNGVFKSVFKTKNYNFIPNAIKFDFEENIETSEKKASLKNCNFLYVGRLAKQKNIPVLLEALSHLFYNDWKMTLVGKGDEEQHLKSITHRLRIHNKVSFEDFADNIKTYYQKADVLILPSLTEGMPNVVFEAAVFDTILILSDIPQHKRWFTHQKNALLFNPKKPEELASCIKWAISMSPKQKKEMFLEVHKILNGLTKEKYIERYTNLYEKLINEQAN